MTEERGFIEGGSITPPAESGRSLEDDERALALMVIMGILRVAGRIAAEARVPPPTPARLVYCWSKKVAAGLLAPGDVESEQLVEW